MKIIVDQEIKLIQMSQEFAPGLFSLVQKNINSNLCYWCPDLKITYATLASTLTHINDANEKFKEDKTPDFIILYKNSLSGLISLGPVDKLNSKSEIGYWLGAEFEGKGLVSRSFPFILDYAKNSLRLKSVELSTADPNVRSQKIPLKFGFKKIKLVPLAEKLADRTVDHILWIFSL